MSNWRQFYISPFQSDLLDLSRWVAALLVVVEHLRSLMFADHGTHDRIGIIGKLFYFFTGFGHSAVMIFFVMSGFLVGGKVLERLIQRNFDWQKYAIDRVSRLYAVYVLALLLGGGLDWFGWHSFNQYGLYDQKFPGQIAVINHDFHQTLSLPVFTVNLAMCQTILGPVFGSNGPLWSLANEFWYYVAAPLLFGLFFTRARWRLLLGVGALAVLFWFLPAGILIYFLVWLIGAGIYFTNSRALLPLWISLVLFAVCFSVARIQWIKIPYIADFLIGISFAMVINSAAGGSRRFPWHNLSRKTADFSYSVYLCHFPFLVFVLSALYEITGIGLRMPITISMTSLFFLILVLTYLWCYLISLVSERQTSRIRECLYRYLGRGTLS
jgi:peptidoglycan/LPS O-acetylase OafA/YrhL